MLQKHTPALSSIMFISLFLSACGGGGAGGTGSNASTGTFVDSPVEGLSFSTPTQAGLTNANGEYKYINGEVVTFKIGNVEIGSAFGAEYLSPLDITNSFIPSDTNASNIARLLQTLDVDGDPENGIMLPATVVALDSTLDINNIAAVEAAIFQTLVSAGTAEAHLDDSLSALPPRSVEDVYRRVTIGSTGNAGCPAVVDAQITVSRDANGARIYDGNITLSSGALYTFTADDSTIRIPTIADDPGHIYTVDLNTFEGTIDIRATGAISLSKDCGEIYLTTDTAVNLPPIAKAGKHVTTIPGCINTASTYDLDLGFFSYDKDGFIVNDIEVKFATDGNKLATLTKDDEFCDLSGSGGAGKTWNPAPKSKTGCYRTGIIDNIPCTSGFSWEITATDNEGLTTTTTGGSSAPINNTPPVINGRVLCNENYPSEACDIVSNTSTGQSVSSLAAGSCSSVVPQPLTTINSNDLSSVDPTVFLGNVIVVYAATPGISDVTCLVEF